MNSTLKSIRAPLQEQYWKWENQLRVKTEKQIYQHLGGKIGAGPFAGLKYVDICAGAGPAGKYLGIYEKELWPIVDQFLRSAPDVIIDVGAAEGYYAVALLTKLPKTHVIAFEADQKTQNQLVEMATMNGVRDRIKINGFGDKAALNQAFRDAGNRSNNIPWLIVDIEGGEKELLNPADVPSLKYSPILVELHDCLVPGCYETIKARFEKTHEIKEIQSQIRALDDVPLSLPIPGWKLKKVIRERGHQPMIWFWMQPFNRHSQASHQTGR